MPVKTILAVLTFLVLLLLPQFYPAVHFFPPLGDLKTFDPRNIAAVWDLPVPAPGAAEGPSIDELRAKRLEVMAPHNLIDPKHELDHFYAALLKGEGVRVVHYGDSPTTADLITADVRALLQKQFGDAGTGFVLIARPWAWYNHRGVDMDSSNWKIDVAGATETKDGLHGLGGASFRGAVGAEAKWTLKDGQHRAAEVSFLAQPDGGTFSFEADGKEIGTADTSTEAGAENSKPGFVSFDLPAGSTKFVLRVTRGPVRLYGVEFRKAGPGVLYSSLGVNGANVTMLSRAFNGPHWTAMLRHYRPDLVVLAYGTNESGYPQFVDSTWGPELKNAVRRVRAALPEASILLMSPMDRGERNEEGEINTVRALPHLVDIETRIAADSGMAFFNTFQAMGGEGTMARWYAAEPRLVGADYIHPMPGGAKIVGELLYRALRDGYNEYKIRELKNKMAQAGEPLGPAQDTSVQTSGDGAKTAEGETHRPENGTDR
jgi:lysophospholipase L1-like esterase